MRLRGKVAIVTGSSQGIGRGIAVGLAREGAEVVINDHLSEARGQETLRSIESVGGAAIVVKADVAQAKDVDELIAAALKRFGRIDILVNNAGVVSVAPITEMTEEDWDRVLDVDLKGMFLCSRAAAKQMIKAGKGGKIVNISSVHAHRPEEGRVHYAAAKAGIVNMTKAIALELAPFRINVNCISPGAVETGMGEALDQSEKERSRRKRRLAQKIPWRRIGTAEDVANAALFLASAEADYCTGIELIVDGGWLLLHSDQVDPGAVPRRR